MDIYVVKPGDNIYSIANKYNISVERLISDNGLVNPYNLVVGQTLVILYPKVTYNVKQGDTLEKIADNYGVSVMQLIRNNPFLNGRDYIYPNDILVISYNSVKDLQTNGYSYVFINRDMLKRTLPYLTYLSVFNYRIGKDAKIIDYGDETDLIKMAKDYNTIPLLMISAFSTTGELEIENVYQLLLSDEKQDNVVKEILNIVRKKGFYGINMLLSYINESNQGLYFTFLTKVSQSLRNEGYLFVVTIPPDLEKTDEDLSFKSLDYKAFIPIVDKIIFLQSIWGKNKQPPSPVSNISFIRPFVDYITKTVPPENVMIGKPLIGYDWELPFTPSSSYANSLSLDSVITLAYIEGATIYLDEESQTPYFNYVRTYHVAPENHIVWFISAFSIKALADVINEYDLVGSGIWNITNFNQQVWSIINAIFNIKKFPVS